MPLPTSIDDLSTIPGDNFPQGTDAPDVLDNVIREHAAYIAELRNGKDDLSSTASGKGAGLVGNQNGGTVQGYINSRRIEGVVLTPPSGFGWTPPILPVHDGQRWRGHVSAKSLFPAKDGATYYVDPVNGLDANAGTEAAPFKLVSKALAMADVGEVLLAPAPNYSNDDGSWNSPTITTSAAHVIVRPWRLRPGRPKVSNRWQHYPASWTNVGGGQDRVWTATRTNVTGVWDFSGAEPVQYVQLASQASCQNRPGTYFYDGTTIAVHTLNSVAPNRDLRIFIGNTCCYWNSTKGLYVDGIDFEGGIAPVWVPDTSANLIFHDVSSGFTNGNAYQIETSGTVIMDGCTAKYAGQDGFNYHDSLTYGPGKFVEVNCRAHNIGWAGASTQASTCHDGTTGVRIGGEYMDAWLQLIADVSAGTKTWNVGGRLGRSSMSGTNSIGVNISEGIGWFYDFDFGSSRNDLILSSGGTAYIDRSRTKNASGALTYRQV